MARDIPYSDVYKWNAKAGRYVHKRTGRFVKNSAIKADLERVITESQHNMIGIADSVGAGRLTLNELKIALKNEIKRLGSTQAALANGGFAQMTLSDWGFVGSELKKQYNYAKGFIADIAKGKYGYPPSGGAFENRLRLYAQAGRGIGEQMTRRRMLKQGMTQERRVLGAADHCPDCLDYASRGWQAIGTLPRIGDSVCVTNCRCGFEYK